MAIEIIVPSLGDGIETADVLEVLVNEGDTIEKEQGIVELETDKATAVVPATLAGTVSRIHVGEGDTVPVGAVLLTIEASTVAPESKPPESKIDTPPKTVKHAPQTPVEVPSEPVESTPRARSNLQPTPEKQPATVAVSSDSSGQGNEIPAGPAMRRFAREVGVNLSGVDGSGDAGRITREDILRIVRSGGTRLTAGATGENDGIGPVRREKMSRMRRTIAAQMHKSWTTVPRVTNFDDADVSDLENIRKSSKADYAERGIKLTSMPFVIKAVAMALRDHPVINASLDPNGTHVIYKEYINIGVAVDTDRGLVVPALRGVDDSSIPEIAKQLGEIADNVRENKFTVDDLKGSTFTISNLGTIGGTWSTPIINVPETAILLIGRSRKMPAVFEDKIVPRLMMPLSISYDHRLVDGGAAARFLNDVIGYLEAPSRLLLAP